MAHRVNIAFPSASVPAAWTPASPTDEQEKSPVAWWHATALTGLSTADPVATFPDVVGAADLTQATAGLRPTYRAADFGGLPCVRGDGTQWIGTETAGISAAVGISVFTACRINTGRRDAGIFTASKDATTQDWNGDGLLCPSGFPNVDTFGFLSNWRSLRYESTLELSAPSICEIQGLIGTGSYQKILLNGTLLNTRTSLGTAITPLNRVRMFWRCLPSPLAAYMSIADVAEVVWYASPLSAADAAQVRAYLAVKYGITVA